MQPWLVYWKFIYKLFWRKEFSKITNRIGKKLFQSSRTYAVKRQFLAKNPTFRLDGSIRYSTTKYAVRPRFFKILRIEMENYPIIIRMGMY
jgi:hypothetical protein